MTEFNFVIIRGLIRSNLADKIEILSIKHNILHEYVKNLLKFLTQLESQAQSFKTISLKMYGISEGLLIFRILF